MAMRLLTLLLFPSACSGKFGATCRVEDVDGVSATVDGVPWSASEVSWFASGDSIHLVNTSAGAGWFSVVAQKTASGDAVGTLVSAGDFPIEVILQTGVEGGFATWYSEDGASAATTEGGEGTLALSGESDQGLSGCLTFTAGPNGADVDFADGEFTAVSE